MAERPINARQRQKYDTSTNWETNNPILLAGEIGVESDTNKIKVGNGTSNWNDLGYSGGSSSKLYDKMGYNTDGAMTQSSTTENIKDRLPRRKALTVVNNYLSPSSESGVRRYCLIQYTPRYANRLFSIPNYLSTQNYTDITDANLDFSNWSSNKISTDFVGSIEYIDIYYRFYAWHNGGFVYSNDAIKWYNKPINNIVELSAGRLAGFQYGEYASDRVVFTGALGSTDGCLYFSNSAQSVSGESIPIIEELSTDIIPNYESYVKANPDKNKIILKNSLGDVYSTEDCEVWETIGKVPNVSHTILMPLSDRYILLTTDKKVAYISTTLSDDISTWNKIELPSKTENYWKDILFNKYSNAIIIYNESEAYYSFDGNEWLELYTNGDITNIYTKDNIVIISTGLNEIHYCIIENTDKYLISQDIPRIMPYETLALTTDLDTVNKAGIYEIPYKLGTNTSLHYPSVGSGYYVWQNLIVLRPEGSSSSDSGYGVQILVGNNCFSGTSNTKSIFYYRIRGGYGDAGWSTEWKEIRSLDTLKNEFLNIKTQNEVLNATKGIGNCVYKATVRFDGDTADSNGLVINAQSSGTSWNSAQAQLFICYGIGEFYGERRGIYYRFKYEDKTSSEDVWTDWVKLDLSEYAKLNADNSFTGNNNHSGTETFAGPVIVPDVTIS